MMMMMIMMMILHSNAFLKFYEIVMLPLDYKNYTSDNVLKSGASYFILCESVRCNNVCGP